MFFWSLKVDEIEQNELQYLKKNAYSQTLHFHSFLTNKQKHLPKLRILHMIDSIYLKHQTTK